MPWRSWGPIALVAMFVASGCQQSEFTTTAVRGTVLCNGVPVTEGNLTFSPIPKEGTSIAGKTAVAVVAADGTFQLSTSGKNDGAIIGRHRMMYTVPDARPNSTPCGAMVVQEIEITSGIKEIVVELGKKK